MVSDLIKPVMKIFVAELLALSSRYHVCEDMLIAAEMQYKMQIDLQVIYSARSIIMLPRSLWTWIQKHLDA